MKRLKIGLRITKQTKKKDIMKTEIKYWWARSKNMTHNTLNTGVDISYDASTRAGRIYVNTDKFNTHRECFNPLNEL